MLRTGPCRCLVRERGEHQARHLAGPLQVRLMRPCPAAPGNGPRAIGRRALAESLGPARRLDLAGLALATGVVFAFTDGLLRGPGRRLEVPAGGALRSPRHRAPGLPHTLRSACPQATRAPARKI